MAWHELFTEIQNGGKRKHLLKTVLNKRHFHYQVLCVTTAFYITNQPILSSFTFRVVLMLRNCALLRIIIHKGILITHNVWFYREPTLHHGRIVNRVASSILSRSDQSWLLLNKTEHVGFHSQNRKCCVGFLHHFTTRKDTGIFWLSSMNH